MSRVGCCSASCRFRLRSARIRTMRRISTALLCTALLVASFQASYSHFHLDPDTEHAKHDHAGQGLTLHTHLPSNHDGFEGLPNIQSRARYEYQDAVFLPWAAKVSHLSSFPTALVAEIAVFSASDPIAYFVAAVVQHSHDPPLLVSSAPRSPPV